MCGGVVTDLGRAHRSAGPLRRGRGRLHRPARREPAGEQLAARGAGHGGAGGARRGGAISPRLGPAPARLPRWDVGTATLPRETVLIDAHWDLVRRLMWDFVGIVRNDHRLALAARYLRDLPPQHRELLLGLRARPRSDRAAQPLARRRADRPLRARAARVARAALQRGPSGARRRPLCRRHRPGSPGRAARTSAGRVGLGQPGCARRPTWTRNRFSLIEELAERQGRFRPDAYFFVLRALEFTRRRLQRPGHVSGRELAEGARDLALEEFGPMAFDVVQHWGLTGDDRPRADRLRPDRGGSPAQDRRGLARGLRATSTTSGQAFEQGYRWWMIPAPPR